MMSLSASLPKIAAALGATRPLVLLDLETTGTSPQNDRIVQIAIAKWFPPPSFDPVSVKSRRINPGVPIPKGATAVHGIGDADVAGCHTFAAVASSLAEQLTGCDFVGFNIRSYDIQLLAAEFSRAQKPFDFCGAKLIDAKELFFRREPRDLSSAVRFYCGESFTEAHDALADIGATANVLLSQMERYQDLPVGVSGLADYCLNRAPESLTDCGKIAWREGAPRFTFGKNAGVSLMEVDPGYLRWVVSSDFPADMKAICAKALNCDFPSKPKGIE